MKKWLDRNFPVEFRIIFSWIIFVFILLIVIPLTSFALWYAQPKGNFGVLVLDKTAPHESFREHQSLHWLLNHFKYRTVNGKPYLESVDYLGFFPENDERKYYTKDFNDFSPSQVDSILTKNQFIYFADTYGVFENDLNNESDLKLSNKIYGGMDRSDLQFLERAFELEKDVIAEFNTIASPTPKQIRLDFEKLAEIKWTGWIARHFDELDTLLNDELPRWLVDGYIEQHENRWNFEGSGLVFLHENGRIEILRKETDLMHPVPNIMTSPLNQKKYNLPELVKYPYWIDIMLVSRDYEVISYYDIAPTPEGLDMLRDMGLPRYFPAAVVKPIGTGKFYYFCGDFADNPVAGGAYRYYGIGWLYRMILQADDYSQRNSFFWNYYFPIMNVILQDSWDRNNLVKK